MKTVPVMADPARPYAASQMFRFLLILTAASQVGLQGWRTLFDNFAVREVGLNGEHIGIIQSVREVPGFLALLVVFVMLLFKEHRISAYSVVILGLGIALTGLFPTFVGLLTTTVIMSVGFHYFETTNQSLTLQYFDKRTSPLVFGRLRSVAAASNIGVGLFVLLFAAILTYQQMYLVLGLVIALAAIWSLSLKPTDDTLPVQHRRMIFRSKYWLYYLLTLLAGARRQIFVAFAVFLMVKKFDFSIQEITALFVLNNVVNYFLNPLIGRCINWFGERWVLTLEYFSLIFVFLAYAVVDSKWGVAALYITDHIFYNFAVAIRTFFQKIGDPQDIAPSMAMGFTINHIGAVIFPLIGGLLWMLDYRIPFVAGAVLSLMSLTCVQFIPGQLRRAARRAVIPEPVPAEK